MYRFQNLLEKVRSNTVLSLIDQVVVSGTRFVTTVMVGRFGSDSELGIYSLAFSLVILVLSFQEALISTPYTIFVTHLDKLSQKAYSTNTLIQALCLSFLATILLLIGCAVTFLISEASSLIWLLTITAVLLPLMLIREFARRFAFAHLKLSLIHI